VHSVALIDRDALTPCHFTRDECEFAYRSSRFKREPDRWLVTEVTFRLTDGGAPTLRYRELVSSLAGIPKPTLADTRAHVLRLRASKSMVIAPDDPNRRSAGSFFTNPIVPDAEVDRLVRLVLAEGVIEDPSELPRYPASPGHSKLAAGWLIERAGIPKGYRKGPVGVSSRHTLALVHHGGGTTAQLLSLATEIRTRVYDRFGIVLMPEPVLLGTSLPHL
jgi:UDP-N-acetylmuramate dehydrogenase